MESKRDLSSSAKVFAVALVGVLSICAARLAAQVTTGTIQGTIADASGAVLPGARIEATHEATGTVRMFTADAAGRFSISSLPIGAYKVAVSMDGFQTEVRTGVSLAVGGTTVLDFKLHVGAVTQTVEVTGEAPLVQTTESAVSFTVQDQQLRDLPLNGRDMSQLILLNPGVNVSNNQGGQAFNGYGARISIAGMRGEDNTYLMDGQLIGDFRRHIPAGPSGAMLGVESVQEFQVITNSVGAQYGRVLGGVFNAVSKSGTNQYHGDAYDFLRNDKLDASRWEDNKNENGMPPFRRNQFGGTIGGPIQKDKIFFWVGYEDTRESLGQTKAPITLTAEARSAAIPSMVPYVNQYPLPTPNGDARAAGAHDYIFTYKQPTTEHFGQARVDFPALRQNDSLFFRFTGSHSERNISIGFPGYEQDSSLGSWLVTLSETHVISPTAINLLRIHFSRVLPLDTGSAPPPGPGIQVAPGQQDAPELAVTDLGGIGGGGFATKPTIMTANRFTYQDDVNWTKGGHAIKFGGFLERFQLNSTKPNRAWGVWTFNSIPAFLAGTSTQFRGAVNGFGGGVYSRGWRNWMFALYLQDDWRVSDRLTINMGVRWEPYSVPTEVNNRISNLRSLSDTAGVLGSPYWENKSKGDIGPRVGLAWSPFASGKTSVRAGFGLLFAPNDPNLYYNQMDRNPPLGFDYTLTINTGCNRFPDAVAELTALTVTGCPAGAKPQQSPAYVVPFQDSYDSRATQWNFTMQQQVGNSSLATIGYVGSRGTHLLSVGDYNMPRATWDGTSLAMDLSATLVNQAWPSILMFANNTSSTYHALLLSYQKRFSQGFQGSVSYTWSKSLAGADSGQTGGGVTSGGGRQKYPYENAAQWGLSGYNFKHNFSFNYSYEIPVGKGMGGVMGKLLSGWQTTGVVTLRSGQPVNLTAAVPSSTAGCATGTAGVSCFSLRQLSVNPRSPNAPASGSVTIWGPPNDSKDPSGKNHYFKPDDFGVPGVRELGNLGRNTMVGPNYMSWNPALLKKSSITERTTLEFRTEFFNILNRPNFGSPANSVFTATGGVGGTAGVISSTIGTPRQVQFALKLIF